MDMKHYSIQKIFFGIRYALAMGLYIATGMFFCPQSGSAIPFEIGGKPANFMGYINQSVAFGVAGDHYDTKSGFQSALSQALMEIDYGPHPDWKLYAAGKLVSDWGYDILHSSDSWSEKGLNRSRRELAIDDDLKEMLHELHLTWSSGNFLVRVGKQIVVWGETDGFRIMDQINPLDQTRGLTDVEFETSVLPIWLVRAEYYLQPDSSWLQDVGFEFVFNPNLDFQPNKSIVPGNDRAGIWAPYIKAPLGGRYPFDYAHLGSFLGKAEEPDSWDDDGFEYGFRLRTIIKDTIITLNYFYGRDNEPLHRSKPDAPRMEVSPYDGRFVIQPFMEGYYPLFRLAGATFTRDLQSLIISSLGGVSPVLRLEGFYAFDNTFGTEDNRFKSFDEVRWSTGVDWKLKINWLNPRAFFFISAQFYHRRIVDYPSHYELQNIRKNNYQTSLMINTSYFHTKLKPSFFWLYDKTNKSHYFKSQIDYEYTDNWIYMVGWVAFNGNKVEKGFEPLAHKDQVYFTIAYRF